MWITCSFSEKQSILQEIIHPCDFAECVNLTETNNN